MVLSGNVTQLYVFFVAFLKIQNTTTGICDKRLEVSGEDACCLPFGKPNRDQNGEIMACIFTPPKAINENLDSFITLTVICTPWNVKH